MCIRKTWSQVLFHSKICLLFVLQKLVYDDFKLVLFLGLLFLILFNICPRLIIKPYSYTSVIFTPFSVMIAPMYCQTYEHTDKQTDQAERYTDILAKIGNRCSCRQQHLVCAQMSQSCKVWQTNWMTPFYDKHWGKWTRAMKKANVNFRYNCKINV